MATIAAACRAALAGALLALLPGITPVAARALSPSEPDTTAHPAKLYRVSLKDGTNFIGIIVSRRPDSLMMMTGSNISIAVSQRQVEEIEEIHGTIVDGEYRRSDPNASRLFFGPTARAVQGGYFADYEIFFPFLSFGFDDAFTITGGVTLFPGASNQLYYVAPKISLPLGMDNFSLAGGVLYTNITNGNVGGAGIAYGVATIGSRDASLTAGLGLGFAGGSWGDNTVLLVGGEVRLSNSMAIITENWIPTGGDVQLLSFGFRFFGDHLSADLGLFHPTTASEGFPFLPWVGFCYNFGS